MSTHYAVIDIEFPHAEDIVDVMLMENMPNGEVEEADHLQVNHVDPTDFTLNHLRYVDVANTALYDLGVTKLGEWEECKEGYRVAVEKQY